MADDFNPDAYLEEEFNPDEYISEEESISEPVKEDLVDSPVSKAESVLQGVTGGATMGFLDELSGGAEAIGQAAGVKGLGGPITDIGLTEEGPTLDREKLLSAYREGRDAQRMRSDIAEKSNPKTYLAADLAGSVAVPVPGASGAKALSKSKKMSDLLKASSTAKKAAATGAAVGGLEAAGRSEEDLLSAEGLSDVGVGAITGGALGGAIGKFLDSKKISKLEEKAKKLSEEANIAALRSTGAKTKDLAEELGTKTNIRASLGTAKGGGATLMDEGVIKMRQSADELKTDIIDKMDEVARDRMVPHAKKLDDLSIAMPQESLSDDFSKYLSKSDDMLEKLEKGSRHGTSADKSSFAHLQDTNNNINEDISAAMASPTKFNSLIELKRDIQSKINWNNPDATMHNEYLNSVQRNIGDLLVDMGAKVDPEASKALSEANRVYSNLSRANKVAAGELVRDLGKKSGLSFTDYLASGVISGVSRIPGAGPAVVASKKLAEKVMGKDGTKILDTFEALNKASRASSLREKASSGGYKGLRGIMSKSPVATSAGIVAASEASKDSENLAKKSLTMIKSDENDIQALLDDMSDSEKKQFSGPLEKAKNSSTRSRQSILYGLMQQASFRDIIDRTSKIEEGE